MTTLGDSFLDTDVAALWPRASERIINTAWVHCSASDRPEHDDARVIDRWHKQRGWSGIGYHAFVTKAGVLQYGRSWSSAPAHAAGYNDGAFAVCLHGLALERFTAAQRVVLRALAEAIDELRVTRGALRMRWRGHCEVAPKACPVVPYREWLGLNSDGYLTGVTGPQPVHRQDDGLLRITARGPAVKALQLALNRAGAFLAVDGLFGQATHVAVMGYQGARDLPVDGVAGPRTIAALRADGLIGEDAP